MYEHGDALPDAGLEYYAEDCRKGIGRKGVEAFAALNEALMNGV